MKSKALLLLGQGPAFWHGVFRVPKNVGLENQKTTCYASGQGCFSLQKTSNVIISAGSPTALKTKEVSIMDSNSLSHTRWNCKYHIVFAPKYRRKVAYGKIKQDIANILSMLCKRKSVKIIEAEICPDHVHMLVEIPPSMSVSYFVGYLKGKSTLMIFERHANLKYKYGNRHFWCRGY